MSRHLLKERPNYHFELLTQICVLECCRSEAEHTYHCTSPVGKWVKLIVIMDSLHYLMIKFGNIQYCKKCSHTLSYNSATNLKSLLTNE